MIAPAPQPVRAPRAVMAAGTAVVQRTVAPQETATVMFRVNQVGYIAGAPKRALVMVRGRRPARRFTVVSSGGRMLLRGTATGPSRWNARYTVYTLSFGALQTPGRYMLRFDGRRSSAITIGTASTLYRPLADSALSFLQSQRDGPEVIAGSMHRQPAHLDDSTAAVYRVPRYRGEKLIGPLLATGEHVDVSGGWFDAGDYLKFVETASFTDVMLLLAARDDSSGVSDPAALLAEARYGTDWLLKMWDQTRRVLYFQVGIGDGNGSSILGDHDLWRLPQTDDHSALSPKAAAHFATHRPVFAANAPGAPISPNLAGRVAAAFALCTQVFAQSDPAYATRCLQAGQTIYDQANTHPVGALVTSVPHAYYDETEWRDDMALGATELYLATARLGELGAGAQAQVPHTDLAYYLARAGGWANAYIEAPGSGEDSLNIYDVSTLADTDLAAILRTPVAQVIQAMVTVPTDPPSLLADRADQLSLAVKLARQEPFGLANPATALDTVPHALGYAIEARDYDALAGSDAFEALAQQQLGWVLGANAWGSSFIVGAGTVYPHCLASQIPNLSGSLNGRGAILRGATVDGPTAAAEVRDLELPEGARPCPARGSQDPFTAQRGHGLAYLDDVRSFATSEPADDFAALTLLASAQLAVGG